MSIFLDTGNLKEIEKYMKMGIIRGVTTNPTILLKDGAGNEFRTSNSTVITSVIDEMKRTLDVKVREVEEMISL